MIKVLQVIDGKTFSGIARMMFGVGKNINKDIEMDFLTAANIYDEWNNLDISRETLRGRLIYNHRLYKFLKENSYDIIHINSGAFFFTLQVVIISKRAGIKNIIVHSHNTLKLSRIKKFLIKLLNPLYCKMISVKLTCSKQAAKSLFRKTDDVILVKNGIDVEKFKYNEKIREEYRKDLNIENKIVYGNVGRLEKQKNHDFLIDVFYELQKKQKAVLLLIGKGTLENSLKEKVANLKIQDKVIFLGYREDTNKLLNAIDIFILPSLYEGLPVSLIEAQTNGLPTIVSNGVTNEANISENFTQIASNQVEIWIKEILKVNIDSEKRTNAYKNTIKNEYDIKYTAKQLERIYFNLINNK